LSHIFSYHLKKKCLLVGRIGGQYAKPRSFNHEIVNGEKVEVFRGEIVNNIEKDKRVPDPNKLIDAYNSSLTVNHYINEWNKYSDKTPNYYKEFTNSNCLNIKSPVLANMMKSLYNNFEGETKIDENIVFTSHEGLLLNYEECFVQKIKDKFYDLSSHLLWIGERTNSFHEAHVEFFSHLDNPIGIKVSTRLNIDDLVKIVKKLNPINEKGKILLILRLGVDNVNSYLNTLCKRITSEKLNVLWMCDPMHGNTKISQKTMLKTRYFDEIKTEIFKIIKVLKENLLNLNGIHLEATFEDITECIGGRESNIIEDDLIKNYTSYCDPRLNLDQSIELSYLVAEELKNN